MSELGVMGFVGLLSELGFVGLLGFVGYRLYFSLSFGEGGGEVFGNTATVNGLFIW